MVKNMALFMGVLITLPVLINSAESEHDEASRANATDLQVAAIREAFRTIVEEGTVPEEEVTWNPVKIITNRLLTFLCRVNVPGNYQNPFNCNQFIMCAADRSVWLWQCPAQGAYNPLQDTCLYPGSAGAQCPWKSTWLQPVNCSTLAPRPYWGPLTLPIQPGRRCGRNVCLCRNNEHVGTGKCRRGFGYSKAYMGCLPYFICNKVDNYFGL